MQSQGPWDDCPLGVVADMACRLRRRKQQTQVRSALVGLAVLLFVAIGYGLTNHDESGSRAGLNCRETVPLLAKYHDRSLDAAVTRDVREHLSNCPNCRKHYEELYPSEVRNRTSVDTRLLAVTARFSR